MTGLNEDSNAFSYLILFQGFLILDALYVSRHVSLHMYHFTAWEGFFSTNLNCFNWHVFHKFGGKYLKYGLVELHLDLGFAFKVAHLKKAFAMAMGNILRKLHLFCELLRGTMPNCHKSSGKSWTAGIHQTCFAQGQSVLVHNSSFILELFF